MTLLDDMLTKRQVAAKLNKTPRTIDRLCREEGLPYHKIGNTRFFVASELEAWVLARGPHGNPSVEDVRNGHARADTRPASRQRGARPPAQ